MSHVILKFLFVFCFIFSSTAFSQRYDSFAVADHHTDENGHIYMLFYLENKQENRGIFKVKKSMDGGENYFEIEHVEVEANADETIPHFEFHINQGDIWLISDRFSDNAMSIKLMEPEEVDGVLGRLDQNLKARPFAFEIVPGFALTQGEESDLGSDSFGLGIGASLGLTLYKLRTHVGAYYRYQSGSNFSKQIRRVNTGHFFGAELCGVLGKKPHKSNLMICALLGEVRAEGAAFVLGLPVGGRKVKNNTRGAKISWNKRISPKLEMGAQLSFIHIPSYDKDKLFGGTKTLPPIQTFHGGIVLKPRW